MLKPNVHPPQTPVRQDTITPGSSAGTQAEQSSPVGVKQRKPKPTIAQLAAETDFDLSLARLSFMIDVLSHSLVSLSSTDPTTAAQTAFVGFTMLSSLGSGVVPSMQSLALCILQGEELERLEREGGDANGVQTTPVRSSMATSTGALFGALAILQAIGQMIIGVSTTPSPHCIQETSHFTHFQRINLTIESIFFSPLPSIVLANTIRLSLQHHCCEIP